MDCNALFDPPSGTILSSEYTFIVVIVSYSCNQYDTDVVSGVSQPCSRENPKDCKGGGDFRVSEKTNNIFYTSAAPAVCYTTNSNGVLTAAAYRVGLVFLEIVCDPDAAREDRTSGYIVYYNI